ncbi:hypothetical protein RvY_17753 [Ramazzottius varieornatus]|uniref:Uncharacterized protein n=1 Tax=Ramazzottius varieornatus TaxID=947166 RepID=A0A1D1W3W9_RAMVA|nr:hypothetical protein RvY_17753 [Ramazzottius varieornatus]
MTSIGRRTDKIKAGKGCTEISSEVVAVVWSFNVENLGVVRSMSNEEGSRKRKSIFLQTICAKCNFSIATVGRPDVKIDLGSIGSPRKPFDRRRLAVNCLANVTPAKPVFGANSGRGDADGRSDRHNRGRGGGGHRGANLDEMVADTEKVDVVAASNEEVDMVMVDNSEVTPDIREEDGLRMTTAPSTCQARLKSSLVLPDSEGKPKSTKRTVATDIQEPTISAWNPPSNKDQPERQTEHSEANRTWTRTNEHLDEEGRKLPHFPAIGDKRDSVEEPLELRWTGGSIEQAAIL